MNLLAQLMKGEPPRLHEETLGDHIRFQLEYNTPITKDLYKNTCEELKNSIQEVKPDTTTKLSLITDSSDFHHSWSQARYGESLNDNSEQYRLTDLTQDLWDEAVSKQFTIKDPTTKDPYMITLSTPNEPTLDKQEKERRERTLYFYGQSLDPKSAEKLNQFKNQ